MSEQPHTSEHFRLKEGDRVYVNGERVDNGPRLADVLREGDELAYDNIHAEWARESIARTILASSWLAAHDEGVRAAERERLGAEVHVAMEDATVGRLNEPGDWKRGARRIRVAVRRVIDPDSA
jgi:hypothetical protein